jgi:hypothetical protein
MRPGWMLCLAPSSMNNIQRRRDRRPSAAFRAPIGPATQTKAVRFRTFRALERWFQFEMLSGTMAKRVPQLR